MTVSRLFLTPVSESRRIVHERTFLISQLRPDFKDALTQCGIKLDELHRARYTGSLTFNFSQGSINTLTTTESKKITPT